MISLLVSLMLWILQQGPPDQITARNRLKQQAEAAFLARDYALAAALYRRLTETALLTEPALLFNQAQAYFALNDTLRARELYTRLVRVDDPRMAATALSQLGVLAGWNRDTTLALSYFTRALRLLPSYEPARYNYELLRKLQPTPRKEAARQPGAAAEAARPQSPPAPHLRATTQPTPSARREDVLKKLERYNLTAEKAQMLLDAMRAGELDYIRQRRLGTAQEETTSKQTW